MKNVIVKYAGLICAIGFVFGNFVACGAQMYKVSVEDDVVYVYETPGVDDPESPNFGLSQPAGWTKLPIKFRVGTKLSPDQRSGLVNAMRTWEIAVGKRLFQFEGIHADTEGDTFRDLYTSLDDYVNGHYLDFDWSKTEKNTKVLATTIWHPSLQDQAAILTSDIRFNGENYNIGDAYELVYKEGREVVDMETLALHELGHMLGLAHVDTRFDPDTIMAKHVYIGEALTNRYLSEGDVRRAQRIYGCAGVACNIERTMALLEQRQQSEAEVGYAIYEENVENGDLSAH